MRKQNKLHLSILLTCLLFGGLSCKKYEEGPCISLRSKLNRLIGDYKIEYLYVNGIDSTSSLLNQNCNGLFSLYKLNDTRIYGKVAFNSFNQDTAIACYMDGGWSFDNKKEVLNIQLNEVSYSHKPYPIGAFLIIGSVNWEIKRLTNKQLWLETTYDNFVTWVHLIKTN